MTLRFVAPALLALSACLVAGCGPHLHAGGGLAGAWTDVGGERGTAWGPVVSARLLVPEGSGFLTAIDVQPFAVDHPYMDESYRIAYLVPSAQLRGNGVGLRAGIGAAFSAWSGSQRVNASEVGGAIGASLDFSPGSAQRWSFELSFRGASTSDFEMSMSSLSLQVLRRLR